MRPMKRRTHRLGAGILTVLVASSLLLMLAFTVAGTSFHHLSLSNRMQHSQQARNLAEAAIAQAAAELLNNHTKYSGASPPPLVLPPVNEYQRVFLTFDTTAVAGINSQLRSTRLEASLNNLDSDTNLVVAGRTVPGQAAYLRAVGVDHGVERAMEAVIYIPKFPWALASDGPIKCTGNTRIAAVKSLADIGDESKEVPGHVATNAIPSDANEAMVFEGDQVLVTGDAQSASGANFGNSVVRGEKRLGASKTKIPKIDVSSYSTEFMSGTNRFANNTPPPDVSGLNFYDSGLHFNSGITLNNGVVYVKGDVNIDGPIQGEGAIIATGAVNITGTGGLTGTNKVAILSERDVTMKSRDGSPVNVTGLVYSEGKISTENVNFFGNGVSTERTSGAAGMELRDTTLVSAPVDSITVIGTPTPQLGTPPNFQPKPHSDPLPPGAFFGAPGHTFSNIQLETKIARDPATFFDSTLNEYVVWRNFSGAPSGAFDVNGNALPAGDYRTVPGVRPGPPPLAVGYEVPYASATAPAPLTASDLEVSFNSQTFTADSPGFLPALTNYAETLINAELAAMAPPRGPITAAQKAMLSAYLTSKYGPLLATSPLLSPIKEGVKDGQSTGGSTTWTFDLNSQDPTHMGTNFLTIADKIRVLYWREVP